MYKIMLYDNYIYVACRFTELMLKIYFYIDTSGKRGERERNKTEKDIFCIHSQDQWNLEPRKICYRVTKIKRSVLCLILFNTHLHPLLCCFTFTM